MAKKSVEKSISSAGRQSGRQTALIANDAEEVSPEELVKRFNEQFDGFKQLAFEVEHTLAAILEKSDIRVAAISARAKTLQSFQNKVERKEYRDPFADTPDFAGARIVCFYPDQVAQIAKEIEATFDVLSKEDKEVEFEVDQFGYTATHFVIQLSDQCAGPRYDKLKGKKCEIQVRTLLQDVWAIFSHHMMYKSEDQVPRVLLREFHALAGALVIFDTAFQAIRDKRLRYIETTSESLRTDSHFSIATNLDSLRLLLKKQFPKLELEFFEGHLRHVFDMIPITRYPTLDKVHELIEKTSEARKWIVAELLGNGVSKRDAQGSAAAELFRALWLDSAIDSDYVVTSPWFEVFSQARGKYFKSGG